MKKLVASYTFDKTAKTIVSADFTSLEKIQLITNVTSNVIIYNFADPAKGGALSGTTLTLDYDTSAMNSADKLQIFVDEGNNGIIQDGQGNARSAYVDSNNRLLVKVDNEASGSLVGKVKIANNNNNAQVDINTTTSEMYVGGGLAHDAVDAGYPIKIGGKALTSIPTPVANADRSDAWYDEYGRLVVSDKDFELGLSTGTTGLRDRIVAQRMTVLSDSLADGIAGFWTQATATGGGVASTGGEGRLTTSTGATGSAQITSPNVAYYPGQVAWLNSAVRFGDTGTAGNIRRLGMFTVSGTTPQEGFYFELSGTTLNAVTVKAGTPAAVASTSWTRVSQAPFTLDTSYHSFEIRYTANTVWFYIDNVLRHTVSGTTASLTSSLTLPITATNVKTSGGTDITFAIRNIGNGRFGMPGGVVAETGLSAVEALAVGGGTPHDAVDSGNPLKLGGKAVSTAPTAVAANDRVNAFFDLQGRQIVASKAATGTLANVAGSATSVTVLASNTARLGATIYNDSTAILYLKLGATASSTSFTVKMQPDDYYEVPAGYTGIIDGIWTSATGSARVTEIT